MSKSYVIEVGDEQIGLVVREEDEAAYQFHAALPAFLALEDRRFDKPYLAERAAIALAARRRTRDQASSPAKGVAV